MKIIFLDIDGVMNSQLFYEKRHKRRWLKPITYWWILKSKVRYVLNGFEHKGVSLANIMISERTKTFEYKFERLKEETESLKWKWLSELCNEEGYKICISSVWKRHFNNNDEWNRALILFGFNPDVFVGITGARRTERGTEIKEWMDEAVNTHNQTIEKYAIIDDDSDMLAEQKTSFFQTDGYCGLSPNVLYRKKRNLKKKE